MRYLQRDANGEVVGHYANPQVCTDADCADRSKCPKSYAIEEVADDAPEILAWKGKVEAEQAAYREMKARTDPEVLLSRIATLEAEIEKLKGA